MKNLLLTAVAGTSMLALSGGAMASSHREAPSTMNDPCIDNTDLYAWVTPTTHDKLYLIAGYAGLHEPGQGNQQARLCDNVLYEFHITRGIGRLTDALTYQVIFKTAPPPRVDPADLSKPVGGGKEILVQIGGAKQTYDVYKVEGGKTTQIGKDLPVAPPNVGPFTDRIAYGLGTYTGDPSPGGPNQTALYNDAFAATFIKPLGGGAEGRAWSGTRDDPFYLDEKGIFDIVNIRPGTSGQAKDVFAGFNLNMIALEVPTSKVTGTGMAPAHNGTPGDDTLLGVWASASRRQVKVLFRSGRDAEIGPWVQVGREGLPLINASVIGVQDQDRYLRTTPLTDVANFGAYFLNPVLVRDVETLGYYTALGVPQATVTMLKSNRADILKTINLNDIPMAGAHHVPIEPGRTGDVLRVDIATDSQFPNGRRINGNTSPMNGDRKEHVDVSDVLLTVIVSGGALPIGDGVNHNDKPYLNEFPFAALPHQGLTEGHGKVTGP